MNSELLQTLSKYKSAVLTKQVNFILIPCTALGMNDDAANEFNGIYQSLLTSGWNKIVRTPSGGISKARPNFRPPMWDLRATNSCVELTICGYGQSWRIQFRTIAKLEEKSPEKTIYGKQAFNIFRAKCKAFNIDLEAYADDEHGAFYKTQIEKYIIAVEEGVRYGRLTHIYSNCHHLDFHNSFPAGLVNTHPEFYPVVNYFYEKRKTDPTAKAVLNLTIGYLQSIGCCGARWAHLSRDAINDNNARVRELAQRLKDSGRKVLLYNTDGIWYQGEIYHGEGEGKKLGEWENDHINCTLRIKSRGSYEFIEDGQYYPVVRGETRLEARKPRSQWQWGDIFNLDAEPIMYKFVPNQGIIKEEYYGF